MKWRRLFFLRQSFHYKRERRNQRDKRYAKLHLLDNPYCIDREYTYFVPHDLSDVVKKGSFVIVPFGNSNRTQIGIVTEINCDEPQTKTKSIKALASEEIVFSEYEVELCSFMN